MTTKEKDPVLVVLQLSGGNDYLNTVVPYNDSRYYDYRPSVRIPEDRVLRLDEEVGLHPSMGPIQQMYAGGDVAIIHGVGYENSPRSHFRSMDIWHTCEPDTLGTQISHLAFWFREWSGGRGLVRRAIAGEARESRANDPTGAGFGEPACSRQVAAAFRPCSRWL